MSHWCSKYLAVGYRQGADGPEFYDCWNFARLVWLEHYGWCLPALPTPGEMTDVVRAIAEYTPRLGWQEVTEPRDGDGVVFARAKFGSHIGVYIGDLRPPRVLHCDDGGPRLHSFAHLDALHWRRRFFRYGA